jgi:agmatine deiminase
VQLTFPHADTDWVEMLDEALNCFVDIARAISRFQRVLVVCHSEAATSALLADIDPARRLIVEIPSNDTWARDHGGITIFEEGRPVLLDFMFNGWGLKFPADKDNLITGELYRQGFFHVERLERPGLVLEGGGIDSDGRGTLLTTAECLLSPNRNPHLDKAATEERLKAVFGLRRVLWLHHGYLAGDDTDSHIDTLARFCDERTIAYVQCEDPADEHFAALREMERELKAFRTFDGAPYQLAPLPLPEPIFDESGNRLPATYANFLLINGAALAPTYGVPQDETALRRLRQAFPGREVVGIDCRPLILQHGSLHCVTMQYPRGVVR